MIPNHHRRVFMLKLITATSGAAVTQQALAETEKLTEADAYAKSMGFRLDTSKVDKAKYPRHEAASQQCSKCQLYDAKSGGLGECSFYGGRLVPEAGWCRNFKVKKAA